jgi:hypothetical protein
MGIVKDSTFLAGLAGVRYGVARRFLNSLDPEERASAIARFESASDAAPKGVFLCLLCLRAKRGATDPATFCKCPLKFKAVKNLASYYRNRIKDKEPSQEQTTSTPPSVETGR